MPGQPDPFRRATALYQAGRLEEAAGLCRQVLAGQPRHVEALSLLGTIAYETGEYAVSVGHLGEAAFLAPHRPELHNVLGLALRRAGRLGEAAASFRKAIELAPTFARAHHNLGLALRAQNDLAGAVEAFRRAVEIDGRLAEALAGLGEALHALDRAQEAVEVLAKAAEALSDDPAVHAELADALQTAGRLDEAVDAYRRALELDGRLGRALYGLGCAQLALRRHADAAATFRKILAAGADHAPTHHNLAKALFELGQVGEAMRHFRRAAALDPRGPAAGAIAVSIPGDPEADNQAVLEARRRFAENLPAAAGRAPGRRLSPGGKLRIAYICAFFQDRNWMKPVWGLINRHDRQRFEIHLLSDAPRQAIEHGYRAQASDGFHDITGLSNGRVAALIAENRIDLLVDLNGYSYVRRLGLLAAKPAPVLAGWFNLYATTGLASVDYLIADEHVLAPEEERFYTERIVRVPGCCLTFEVSYPVPDVACAPCLRAGRFTFGCLASQYKITPHVMDAWSQVLGRCPESRLVLKNAALGSPDNRAYVREQFASRGIAAERIELDGPSEHYEFLRAYDRIDLALDTFPYNGGTTTTEAIWQGVAVLTFAGDRWASRTSASILRAGGLSELVAADADDYVERAVQWATDRAGRAKLAELRQHMRDHLRASPVCDTETFARNMEDLYLRMCGGQAPSRSEK